MCVNNLCITQFNSGYFCNSYDTNTTSNINIFLKYWQETSRVRKVSVSRRRSLDEKNAVYLQWPVKFSWCQVRLLHESTRHSLTFCIQCYVVIAMKPVHWLQIRPIHCVSKKRPTFTTCYNFHIHSSIVTIFCINVTEKVGNQNVLYFRTTRN